MINSYELLIEGILQNGYAYIDDFLPTNDIEGLAAILRSRYAEGEFQAAGIGKTDYHQQDKTIRGDSILWLEPETDIALEQKYLGQIADFIQYLNRTCYTGLQGCELHYALYPIGAFYKRHVDRFVNDESRQYSIILYLNKDWAETDGGHLLLHLDNGRQEYILPKAGRLVCFPSHLIPHEVLMAKRERLSLTGWLKK